ncbi:MAG: CBS domain-containing protein [Thermoplasmata archaeon]
MKWSFRVATIMGIPIYIHLTFLIILPVFAWVFSVQSQTVLGLPVGFGVVDLAFMGTLAAAIVKFLMGALAAIIFFACILLHELGHSYVALRYKSKIRGIVLIIFGGIAQVEDMPRRPKPELDIALAGPSVNFGIAAMGFGLLQVPLWTASKPLELLAALLGIVTFYNLVLALFNLIPAFPMDGGRVLRSFLARRMSYLNATETAASVGKAFAFAFGIFGLFYNAWLILIALFVYLGATEEERLTKITLTLEGVKVGEIMTREVSTVTKEMTVAELLDKMVAEKHMGYPVVDGDLEGVVTFADSSKVPRERREHVRVGQIMSGNVVTVGPRAEAMDALRLMSRHKIGRLVVTQEGQIIGIITRSDLVKSVDLLRVRKGI